MTKQADLIAYVFEQQPHLLSVTLLRWMEASSRFTAFVDTYRDKIRKKVRLTREPENALDLRSELEVAYYLLNDRRLAVAYEPYASVKKRGPDFAVTYRTNLIFNIEVTRIRAEESEANGLVLARNEERFLRILLDKLGQMQPGIPNLLVIHTQEDLARSLDLGKVMQSIKSRAEANDPTFYAISRYTRPVDFFKNFLHLSAILVWACNTPVWVNKQARPILAENVLHLIGSLQCGALPEQEQLG